MTWTFYGTTAGCVLSETTTADTKTLNVSDLPTSYSGFTELNITGIRLELTTSGTAGSRIPAIQLLTADGSEDVLMQIPCNVATAASNTGIYELYFGGVASGTAALATGVTGINCPKLALTPGVKIKILSQAGGQTGDSYVVHVRGEAI